MSDENADIVDRISLAKVGDTVWLYDANAPVYDENRKWLGRGLYTQVVITGETRASFLIRGNAKFDRKTGIERATGGYAANRYLAGHQDRLDRRVIQQRHNLSSAVGNCKDADTLRKIADLVGYEIDG